MMIKRLFLIILLVISIWSIFYLYKQYDGGNAQVEIKRQIPVFTGKKVVSNNYDANGIRNYRMTTKSLSQFSNSGDTNFISPHLLVYQEDGEIEEWEVISDSAVLNKKHELFLTGNVIIENLLLTSPVKRMTTDTLKIELKTKNFSTKDIVHIIGPNFTTQGIGMKGNFDDQTATLLEEVQGIYEGFSN